MTGPDLGAELIRRGWTQGSRISAASARMAFLVRVASEREAGDRESADTANPTNGWEVQQAELAGNDSLVVVSQDCDIARNAEQEPYVEAMRGYWTEDREELHRARMNSFRRFMIRQHGTDLGTVRGLIVDATVRVQVEKAALLTLTPEAGFEPSDADGPRRFSRWLGARYSRQALPDHLVVAVQRPIVEAIRRVGAADERVRILEGVREMLFVPQGEEGPPYRMELWFLANDSDDVAPPVDIDGAARLAGWMKSVIDRKGQAELMDWELFDTRSLSVYDYIRAYQLPLDAYTLTEDTRGSP